MGDALPDALERRIGHEARERLRAARIGIAGAGGLGSNIAVMLARSGVGELVVADFDVVDEGTSTVSTTSASIWAVPRSRRSPSSSSPSARARACVRCAPASRPRTPGGSSRGATSSARPSTTPRPRRFSPRSSSPCPRVRARRWQRHGGRGPGERDRHEAGEPALLRLRRTARRTSGRPGRFSPRASRSAPPSRLFSP